MDNNLSTNRDWWDERVAFHLESEFYDVYSFKRGRSSLYDLEQRELGDVHGKRLLHLMCHIGLDTLSWARQGAQVTGADFSPKSVAAARSLADELDIEAHFVESNVYDLPDKLDQQFDVVFASYGVLAWLPDFARFAEVAAHFLKPGGVFYLADFHPVVNMFDADAPDHEHPQFRGKYFLDMGQTYETTASYAADVKHATHTLVVEWSHTVSDLINGVLGAGLQLAFFNEHPFTQFQQFPFLRRGDGNWFVWPGHETDMPLMFSLKAQKGE